MALPMTTRMTRLMSSAATSKRNNRSLLVNHDTFCGVRIPVAVLVIFTFVFGMAVGAQFWGSSRRPLLTGVHDQPKSNEKLLLVSGSIHRLADTPPRNTAHKDKDTGQAITKQQFLEPFLVPNVAGYSVATLLPSQRVESHEHSTMHEFFYILEGTAIFTIDGKETHVEPGTFVHVAPHEVHEILVPADSAAGAMKMLLSGVVVEHR